jgi:WD40 repeat protein
LTAHDDLITCIAVSNNGQLIASGQTGDNSDVVIWDYNTKAAKFRLSEHDYAVQTLAFSHDDNLLISAGA